MKKLLSALALLCSIGSAHAGVSCSVPFTLTNGTTADATQVMANYNALITCFGNAAAAGVNSDITTLAGLTNPLAPASGGSNVFIGGTSGGTANAQTLATTTPSTFALVSGYRVIFIAGFTNTGALTLNVNALGAKNVFRQTPSGPQAMTGGEVISGSLIDAVYDGTEFQLVNPIAQFGGIGPVTSIASAATVDLGLNIPSHAASITGGTTITSFGSNASTTFPWYYVTFTGSLTLTQNATSLILPGGANITTQAGDAAILIYLGSGNWQVVQYQPASGASVVPATPVCGAIGLKIVNDGTTPNTSIDVTADAVTMVNPATNQPIYRTNVSVVINTTNSNVANGFDGTRGNSAWVNIYLIDNGVAPAGYASLTATGAFTTTPTGYTFRCRLGAMRTDGSSNFLRTLQLGSHAQYTVVASTNVPNLPFITNAATGNVSTPTYTSFSLSNFLPPTATTIIGSGFNVGNGAAFMIAPNNNYGAINSATNPAPVQINTAAGEVVNPAIQFSFVLESTNIFIASNAANPIYVLGWTDKVNAN